MNRIFHFMLAGALLLLAAWASPAEAVPAAVMQTQRFEFVSNGNRLSGFIDVPASGVAQALIVIVHGYGETDVAGRTSYHDLRTLFTGLGVATLIWDKPGCGESEGRFDANQPVESSAQEVLDAVRQASERGLPGAQKIGLWGISRAGWIAPLAIAQDPGIAFWISVSGTDDKENFPYLLESNLRIEGRTEAQIERLLGEWRRGFEVTSRGGTFADYLEATQNLRRDPFMAYFSGGRDYGEAAFLADQAQFSSGAFRVDEATGLMVYVPGFEALLAQVNVPVLAIFGEKDRNVDWRATAALYARTIGQNRGARLTIRTFPDGNHNIQRSGSGGLREMIEMTERRLSEGYHEAMRDWLRAEVLN
jgi:hypothetical protein